MVGLSRVVAGAADAFSSEKSAIIYASAQQASAFFERLEELALADRALLESIVDGLQDGIVVVDREMRTVLSNATGRGLLAGSAGTA